MSYKISIIVPVYNGDKTLENALDSIINQTIGVENLQVIIVDDKSTDNSRIIIDEYCQRHESFEAIYLKHNIGGAYGPKNIGLKHVKAPYIMFLDSDDSFERDACRILYNKITHSNAQIVYGRYKRIYTDVNLMTKENRADNYISPNLELVQKSHSAFKDSLSEYNDDILDNVTLTGIMGSLWRNIFGRIFYGGTIKNPETEDGVFDEIYIKRLEDNIDILKSLPSFWTKIYDADLILSNNIRFPEVISAEDLNFLMEAYFKADGIIFLNNTFIYNYYMRDSEDDKSITKDVSYRLVYDSLLGYAKCSNLCNKHGFGNTEIILNPFLLNWISLYKRADLDNSQKIKLLREFEIFRSHYNCKWKGNLLCSIIIKMINRSIQKKRRYNKRGNKRKSERYKRYEIDYEN